MGKISMTYKELHAFVAALPRATLSIQWGSDHVYKIGGKMFTVMDPPDGKARLTRSRRPTRPSRF